MTTEWAHALAGDGTLLVPLSELKSALTVRRRLDPDHVDRLAEVLDRCPPITVSQHGDVIDGHHRVAAARALGRAAIPATVTDGQDEHQITALAVRANSAHGLPLTREERRSAARALLNCGERYSDRVVADICGLSRPLVAALRAEVDGCSGGSSSHVNTRVGADGKRYPLRRSGLGPIVEAIVRTDPQASVRAIAARVGASVGTVQPLRSAALKRIDREAFVTRWLRALRARVVLWRWRKARAAGATR